MSLSNRALLVNLTISEWSARKLDKRETQELARKHGVIDGVARVNKSLLPMASALDKIRALSNACRQEFYSRTLPWGAEGFHILKADAYMSFIQAMGELRDKRMAAVDELIAEYPRLKADARVALNGMYREEDYPHIDDLRRKFSLELTFMPVPEPSDCARVTILADLADGMAKELAAKLADSQATAMKAAWQRLYEVVAKAHERLADPDNIFRDSLINNAVDICNILPSLNIADDPQLEAMRLEVERSLCAYNPDTLRKDELVREDVAAKMADIMDKMGAFYAP